MSTGGFHSTSAPSPPNFKIFGKEWRINWMEEKYFIMHGHKVGTSEEHWNMAVLEKKDKKGIHYLCRLPECNVKVPAGIITIALTRKLNEALES